MRLFPFFESSSAPSDAEESSAAAVPAADHAPDAGLSTSLEDYLETIYELSQSGGKVRVKDIAGARSVKAASVSVALGKLADLGHVRYERRGTIALTDSGLAIGRKMLSRHHLLCRFFAEVLQLPAGEASAQACAMEHSLTDKGMNQLVRFFEFLGSCPEVGNVIERFHTCPRRHGESPAVPAAEDETGTPQAIDHCALCHPVPAGRTTRPLTALKPGETGRVANVVSHGAIRQRMLDMGLLPNAQVEVSRFGPGGDPVWIRCLGSQVALRRVEAETVLMQAGTAADEG